MKSGWRVGEEGAWGGWVERWVKRVSGEVGEEWVKSGWRG